jgi:predicted nucleic acid-binding protein
MTLYVETNFVLELAYLQEGSDSCEELLQLAEAGKLSIVLPNYCLAESVESATRRFRDRKELVAKLEWHVDQLARSKPYAGLRATAEQTRSALADSQQDELQRLDATLQRMASVVRLLPLDTATLVRASMLRASAAIDELQDSLVLASVLVDRARDSSSNSCFVTTNTRDFSLPEVQDALSQLNCKPLFTFADALGYSKSQLVVP